jgi:glycosyltransferase involved in cell wall biosynthesis
VSAVEFGTNFISTNKILIVGTIRNVQSTIENEILKLNEEFSKVLEVQILVVESDSNDGTIKILEKIKQKLSNFNYITLGNIENQYPDRITRLRHCRNVYVKEIRHNSSYFDCELVAVVDLDGINTHLNANQIFNSLNLNLKWDGIFANQLGPYYDILALRHPLWNPYNCNKQIEFLSQYMSWKRAKKISVWDKMIRIPSDKSPIPVISAFGGLGIYKKWIFDSHDYSVDGIEALEEIDHVTLHRKAKAQNADFYIVPSLINSHWNNHNLGSVNIVRYFRYILYKRRMPLTQAFFRNLKNKITLN